MTPVQQVLSAAADILEKPGAWTQGEMARDASGTPIYSALQRATCFCLYGALERAAKQLKLHSGNAYAAVRDVTVEEPIIWNDTPGRTQAEVVETLRKAAAA